MKTQRNTQACCKQPQCFEDTGNNVKTNRSDRGRLLLTAANKRIWPNMQESGANTEPADCTTIQLKNNGNIMAIYQFWQQLLAREALKWTNREPNDSRWKTSVLDGSCATEDGRISPSQVDFIRSIKDKYDSVSPAYKQKNFGLCRFLLQCTSKTATTLPQKVQILFQVLLPYYLIPQGLFCALPLTNIVLSGSYLAGMPLER